MAVKKQVILPMEEYERLVAAQPEKVVEIQKEIQWAHSTIVSTPNMVSAVFACILCGLSVAGLFWGWGWWDAIPIFFTIVFLTGAGIEP